MSKKFQPGRLGFVFPFQIEKNHFFKRKKKTFFKKLFFLKIEQNKKKVETGPIFVLKTFRQKRMTLYASKNCQGCQRVEAKQHT